jgi:CBS domain containing-hemolysin-like protein
VLNGIAALVLKMFGMSALHETDVHSNDELKYLMQQGKESGEIEPTDYDIIKNAFDFSERKAHQVMVPRIQLFAIDLIHFTDETLEKVLEEGFSRIPCYEGDLDNILGVVYVRELLGQMRKEGKVNLRELMHPVMSVPESKALGPLLKEFQLRKQQIAVVINEYGGTEGIITMEDILEELVGEIQDEFDNEVKFVTELEEKSYQIVANVSLEKVNELLPIPLPLSNDYETLAGLLIEKMGRIPLVGEKLETNGYEFTITHKLRRSILQVKATLLQ